MRKIFSPCLYLYLKFTLIVVFNNGVPEKGLHFFRMLYKIIPSADEPFQGKWFLLVCIYKA